MPRPSRRRKPWSLRLYRLLLGLYPSEFRARYGREMCLVFADRCREQRSGAGLFAVWMQAAAGLVRTAPGEHYDMIAQDVRFAGRMLRRSPLHTAVIVTVLALGIGATTVVFSLANGLLVRPLPYPHPERLVDVDESAPQHDQLSMGVAFPNYLDLRARNRVLADLALYGPSSATLSGGPEAVRVPAALVSASLFRVLGVRPLLGRVLQPEEDRPEGPWAVVLGERLWHDRYGADPALVGKTVRLDGRAVTVVGVMPEGFHFPDQAELWLPLRLTPALSRRTDHYLSGIGRLEPGVTLALADEQLKSIMRQIVRENPVSTYGQTVHLRQFHDQLAAPYRTAVLILFGAVLCVLLIACGNIANLLLMQAAGRAREIAVRTALGASRRRIVRQLLIESLLLGGLGAAAGLALALAGLPALLGLIPVELPRWMRFGVDGRVLVFTLGVSLLTSWLISLAPALLCSRLSLTETLKEGGRGRLGGARSEKIRQLLVVGEVALSLTLLIGGGLLGRSFLGLQGAPAGFDPAHVLTLDLYAPQVKYGSPEKARALVQHIRDELATLPGVISVVAASGVPLADRWGWSLTVEDHPLLSLREAPMVNHVATTPGYFRTLGIPLVEGRDFTPADEERQPVTIVDQDLARRYWPRGGALGKRVRFGPPEDKAPWHTIVGVAGVVRNQTLDARGRSTAYRPHAEMSMPTLRLMLRTAGDPLQPAAGVRHRIAALDHDLALGRVRSMERVVGIAVWRQRFFAVLFAVFAALALLLAAVGLYGVLSYAVTLRRRELGLRVALGAGAGALGRLVLGQTARLSLLGLGLGSAAALAATRLLAQQLYEVKPTDPATYFGMAALLLAVATLAGALPARRAVHTDPMEALREE